MNGLLIPLNEYFLKTDGRSPLRFDGSANAHSDAGTPSTPPPPPQMMRKKIPAHNHRLTDDVIAIHEGGPLAVSLS
jgi:hypothetical protein